MAVDAAIGWDIGGAHLKAARLHRVRGLTAVLQLPCPLWRGIEHLEEALRTALVRLGSADLHAVTMTGEMADAFEARPQGVAQIVSCAASLLGASAMIYAGRRGFVSAEDAPRLAADVASANWIASAAALLLRLPNALLIDIGSTTTDLIAISQGNIAAIGWNDGERLASGELVYSGITRTPLMAVAKRVPFRGAWLPLMAEHFATMADVHRLVGDLPAEADQHPSADGGAKNEPASARRLARMIGRDLESASMDEWRQLARWFVSAQSEQIRRAVFLQLSRGLLVPDDPIVGAGVGRLIAARLAQSLARPYIDFATLFPGDGADSHWVASCAPAVAVAYLALGS
jgi:(4-(4-[2-(gamma-L-glutamylamino)ethyl]phenoxymethyl)furan-2-yl)methanamine synthase